MKSLNPELPDKLRITLKNIICEACDTSSAADTCEWRTQGKYCDVPDETTDKIHEAYYNYQMQELKR